MKRHVRPLAVVLLVAITALVVAACGSSSKSSSSSGGGGSANTSTSSSGSSGGSTPTVNMVQGTFPQSLDPGKDYTTQGSEVNWIVYTGLTTYAHDSGVGGRPADPRPRDRAADDLRRRQDLHGHAAQGPEVLQRGAGEGI